MLATLPAETDDDYLYREATELSEKVENVSEQLQCIENELFVHDEVQPEIVGNRDDYVSDYYNEKMIDYLNEYSDSLKMLYLMQEKTERELLELDQDMNK